MNRLPQPLMSHAWIAVSLAALCCCVDVRADEGKETLNAIQRDYHKYADYVSKLSVRESVSVSLNGDDMMGVTHERAVDGKNVVLHHIVLYDNYALPDPSSLAAISRIRGRFRQVFGLRRATPTSAWVLTQDTSEPLTEDNESLSFTEEQTRRLRQLEAMRYAPGYHIVTIPQMIMAPGFRLGSVTEDRSGSERLVTVEFTIDPPLDRKKAPPSWVQAGRMVLRPDVYWTLKSGTFQLDWSIRAGNLVQCKVTNTFHEDSEKKALPKEVKCVSTVITKDGKKAEEIRRATFKFSSYQQVPEERLSLTQFGMSEREPVDTKGRPAADAKSSPSAERDIKNYSVAYNPYGPLYVWLTGGGVLLLAIGITLRAWLTKSARIRDAAVPPPPSARANALPQ